MVCVFLLNRIMMATRQRNKKTSTKHGWGLTLATLSVTESVMYIYIDWKPFFDASVERLVPGVLKALEEISPDVRRLVLEFFIGSPGCADQKFYRGAVFMEYRIPPCLLSIPQGYKQHLGGIVLECRVSITVLPARITALWMEMPAAN